MQVNPGLDHFGSDELAHFIVKSAQHLLAPVKLRHARAQAVEDGCKFARDIATAHHQQARRERLQVEHVVGREHVFPPLHVGHMGRATSRNQDVPGGVRLPVHLHRVRVHQRGKAVDDLHARPLEQLQVDAVKPGDFLFAIRLERGPVQRGCRTLPAKAVRFFKRFAEVCGIRVELFGDAAHVDAGTAEPVGATSFGQRHPHAALRRHACRAHAATAAANDEQVKLMNGHDAVLSMI